jgi:hypothetical protein
MATTPRIKSFQQTFSPARSIADIGFGVGGMEGLPGRMQAPLSAAPLQRQVMGGGGSGMVPGATNIMLSQLPFASQQQQQVTNPFAGTQFNFPVVQPAQTIGATYNITTGGDPFDWASYLKNLGLDDDDDKKKKKKVDGCGVGFSRVAGVCVKDEAVVQPDKGAKEGTGYTRDDAAFKRLFEAAGGTGLWGQGGLTPEQAYDRWFRAPRGEKYKQTVADYFESLKGKGGGVTQPVVSAATIRKGKTRAADVPTREDTRRVEELVAKNVDRGLAKGVVRMQNKEKAGKVKDPVADLVTKLAVKQAKAKLPTLPTAAQQAAIRQSGRGAQGYVRTPTAATPTRGVGTFRTLPGGRFAGGF